MWGQLSVYSSAEGVVTKLWPGIQHRPRLCGSCGAAVGDKNHPTPPGAMDVVALLADVHGRALRVVAGHAGQHFQGLGHASRVMKALPGPIRRRKANLDVAYAFARHITAPFVQDFLAELEQQLLGQEQSPLDRSILSLEQICKDFTSKEE